MPGSSSNSPTSSPCASPTPATSSLRSWRRRRWATTPCAISTRSSTSATGSPSSSRMPPVDSGKLALVGVRSLDDGERELLGRIDAKVFTMSEVDRIGVEPCMRESLAHAAGAAFLHVSLDMDVVDPDYAPGVGTPVRGGLSYREAHLAMETVAESGVLDSLDVVEVNPILDRENATGQLAVEL